MRFEWDPAKARANRNKHGVSFEEAVECFEDWFAMVLEDIADPERLILIGVSRASRVILTVFAEKDGGETIRIISARKATRRERSRYEEGDF